MGWLDKLRGKPDPKDVPEELHKPQQEPEPELAPGEPEEDSPPEPEEIGAAELHARMDSGDGVQLIDVREDAELASEGWIPGARHIPMNDVPERLGELDREKPIVVYCAMGMRSFGVGSYLLEQGFSNVASLEGGMGVWDGEFERKS